MVIVLEWTTNDYRGQPVRICLDFIKSKNEANQSYEEAALIETGRSYTEHILGENTRYSTPDNPNPFDQDWFRLDFRSGGTVLVDLYNVPDDLDLEVNVVGIDAWGKQRVLTIGRNNGRGATYYSLRASAYVSPGTYFIQVRSRDNRSSTKPYYLIADFIENQHEANQSYDEAALIETGRSYTEHILGENTRYSTPDNPNPFDQDWSRLDFRSGGTVLVDLYNVPDDLDLEVNVVGIDAWGKQRVLTIGRNNGRGATYYSLRASAYVSPGTYFIQVRSRDNRSSTKPYYLIADFIENQHEANQSYGEAALIETGRSYTEHILGENTRYSTPDNPNPFDQDWFCLDLHSGGKLLVDLYNVPNDLDLDLDVVNIDPWGRLVFLTTGNLDGFGATYYQLRASVSVAPGTYFVRVRSRGKRSSTKPYFLFTDLIEDHGTEPESPGIGVSRPTRSGLPFGGRRFPRDQIVGSNRRSLPSAFPNPTYGVVQLSGLRDRATYVVSNSLGQEVASGTAVDPRIDLSRMTAGFYTITIRDDQPDPTTIRIVKR
ncbi:T9SS type A sorting domain-containing protein [Lewinella sp. IMCC34191]|uniref:T9SS type A sorting domain-containing protein n=1 Tax=Lewinella sp. IMCC34191 TaxID=2259172 RepID=UPI000E23277E|nr:T9SS type A sorting domain-containing protein [Lewinella sp. IMCC34191]